MTVDEIDDLLRRVEDQRGNKWYYWKYLEFDDDDVDLLVAALNLLKREAPGT